MLVCHFIAPPIHFGGRWLFIKRSVADRVFTALQDIFTLVPLSPTRLLPVILRRMPSKYAPHNVCANSDIKHLCTDAINKKIWSKVNGSNLEPPPNTTTM